MKRRVLIAVFMMFVLGGFYMYFRSPSFAQIIDERQLVVSTSDGRVQGAADDRVISFKGIPFAQPPVGELRWRAPQPVKPWSGILKATAFRSDPSQEKSLNNISEDCLYLNVYRPTTSSSSPLPVMVWIYGGALANGGASIYPGTHLAEQGIVVVTFNYRVGRLGFFAHPALAKERPGDIRGNYGYMDQIAALQWVKKNIAAFGGDPDNVTVGGESAGGGSVLVLLTSPMARGLFQKAILESPGVPTPRSGVSGMSTLSDAENTAVKYAATMGITGDDKAALRKLRAIPADKLAEGTRATETAIFGGPQVPGISNSIVDGRLVPDDPGYILRMGGQTMVPVLVGANDRDLAISAVQNKGELFDQIGSLAARARVLYDPTGEMPLKELIQNFISDKTMVEPSRYLAEQMTKAGQPAYFYRFSYVAENDRNNIKGVTHAMEIPYVFNAAGVLKRPTAADKAMAATASSYWVSFIKTGDPNNENAPVRWLKYDPNSRHVLNFTNEGIVYGPDPLQERLDLWHKYWEDAAVAGK